MIGQSNAIEQFKMWLRRAKRRDMAVYYKGHLLVDRGSSDNKDARTPSQELVSRLGATAWEAYERGAVTLVQRRVGTDHYIYYAIRR